MNVLDLFSGIGGFSLGLERAGMRTVAFCECDPYCRRVLRKHWPRVPIYRDVRLLGRHTGWWAPAVDLICGGFPCQDISVAGKGVGIDGERSGLWSEFARIIGDVRPRYVIVENVAALLGRGLERVLGDLAALGYDAEWHCIPACAVGAPHRRDRVWIIAYADDLGRRKQQQFCGSGGARPRDEPVGRGADVADAAAARLQKRDQLLSRRQITDAATSASAWWRVEPDVGRVAHGVPARVDRLRALGNAVVPQIVEVIGRAIMAHAA